MLYNNIISTTINYIFNLYIFWNEKNLKYFYVKKWLFFSVCLDFYSHFHLYPHRINFQIALHNFSSFFFHSSPHLTFIESVFSFDLFNRYLFFSRKEDRPKRAQSKVLFTNKSEWLRQSSQMMGLRQAIYLPMVTAGSTKSR